MKIVKILIGLLVVGLIAFGGFTLIKKRQQSDKQSKTALIYPIKVKSFIPKEEHVILTLPYLADVKSNKDITINSKFTGKVLFIKNLGQKVKKSEVVVKIDNSDLISKLKEVQTKIDSLKNKIKSQQITLNNLISTHKRTKALLDVKMASIEEYQNEISKIESLKSSIIADKNSIKALKSTKKSILTNLAYTTIKSPIDGVISAKFVNIGDNVFPAKPILKISSKKGNYLFVTISSPRQEILYKGKVYKLIPLHMSINGLLAYKVKVDDDSLINGQKVNIDIVEFDNQGISIPYDAVLSLDKNYIFDTQGNVYEVNIIAKGKNRVVIKGDIPNEIILAKPDILLKIKGGYPVKIEKE